MPDAPDETVAMVELARKTLLDEILPLVPQEQRYCVLMIANAMGIAAREIGAGGEGAAREREDIARLLGTREGTARQLRERLCAAIRAGAFDDDAALVPVLRRHVEAALAIANPKHLVEAKKPGEGTTA